MESKIKFRKGYTFDDVLLVPQKSKILPKETILNTRLTNEIKLNIHDKVQLGWTGHDCRALDF